VLDHANAIRLPPGPLPAGTNSSTVAAADDGAEATATLKVSKFMIRHPFWARSICSAPILNRAEPARFWPPSTTITQPEM